MIHKEVVEMDIDIQRSRSVFSDVELERAQLVRLALVVEADPPLLAVVGRRPDDDADGHQTQN